MTSLLQLRRQMSKLIKRETKKKGDSSFIIVIKSRLFSAYSCVFVFCSFARHSGSSSLFCGVVTVRLPSTVNYRRAVGPVYETLPSIGC